MKRVVIAIITWNNAEDAITCIESLVNQSVRPTILHIDNNSQNDTVSIIEQYIKKNKYTDIYQIQTGYNGGTAGGFNAAIQWAQQHEYDYVGSLNADAAADKQWVKSLLEIFDDIDSAGFATAKMLRKDGKTIDTTGDFYSIWGIPFPRLRDKPADTAPSEHTPVFGSTGGGFLAKTSVFNDIGLYDETFFMYYEDVDVAFRAQLMGYTTHYTPNAIAYHKLGASSKTVPGLAIYNTFKNLPMLFVKNVPLSLCFRYYPRFVLAYTLILGNAIKNGNGVPALKGWLMSWRYLGHMFRERWRIQKSRTVSDAYIDSITYQGVPPEQTGLYKFVSFFRKKDYER